MRRQSASLLAAVAICASGSAWADVQTHRPKSAETSTSAEKLCDSFGPGFVPAGTPGNCVKVQERLRVEPQARRALSPIESGSAYAPLPMQGGALPAHLRLNGGFGGPTTR